MKQLETYRTPGEENLRIPTKSEFHRYAMEKLSYEDFCTEHPTGYTAAKIATALRWTKKTAIQKRFAYWTY